MFSENSSVRHLAVAAAGHADVPGGRGFKSAMCDLIMESCLRESA